MTTSENRTALVVGASRGLGRGIAAALADTGHDVVPLSRTSSGKPAEEVADATDADTARRLLTKHQPGALVLVAGASPQMMTLPEHTWETFSVNWHADVRITFEWLRAALLLPLRPGSRVVVISSGAAINGSPLSGGYAGAKATQRLITGYAQQEADRLGLGLSFTAVLPRLTPLTALGRTAVQAYADRSGLSEQDYRARLGDR
ncbi:SDR family NAD(P)-dependent oxidoreductase [Catenuloplanes sp. NPDC051500]|uniref:SDR family NAD(P)-dependent oxidoreductase n=1 Tax=Catenuloplanes sp. NPDC051500 TaxID=3363959 RepID=UPI00378EABAB